jgi:hypothetical protein
MSFWSSIGKVLPTAIGTAVGAFYGGGPGAGYGAQIGGLVSGLGNPNKSSKLRSPAVMPGGARYASGGIYPVTSLPANRLVPSAGLGYSGATPDPSTNLGFPDWGSQIIGAFTGPGSGIANAAMGALGFAPSGGVYRTPCIYQLKSGAQKHGHVALSGKCVPNRRMNPMNVRAARRAIRRVKGARRILQRIERALPRARTHHTRGRR